MKNTEQPFLPKKGLSGILTLKRILFLVMMGAFFFAYPEGSKDLNHNGNNGNRIICSADTVFRTFVYAEENEFILVASSALGYGVGQIVLTSPTGVVYTIDGSYYSDSTGIIFNRTQEMAIPGNPAVPGSSEAQYKPGEFQVASGQGGIWTVEFYGPSRIKNFVFPGRFLAANASWDRDGDQSDDKIDIMAWDVTVSDHSVGDASYGSGSLKSGRVFLHRLSGYLSDNEGGGFFDHFVMTNSGIRYNVKAEGVRPAAFVFISNNKGVFNTADNSPTYRSLPQNQPGTDIQEDIPDQNGNVMYKQFLNLPDGGMPTSANYYNGTAAEELWLYRTAPGFIDVTLVEIEGTEGTINQIMPGQTVDIKLNFSANTDYVLRIDVNNNNVFTDAVDVEIYETAVTGLNIVTWDGLNGLGNPAYNAGTQNFNIEVVAQTVVHFPFVDFEAVSNGISIIRLNGPGSPDNTINWDDTSVTGTAAGPVASPGHAWPASFGDKRVIDTWNIIENIDPDDRRQNTTIDVKEADLRVDVITPNDLSELCEADTIDIHIDIANDGPSSVENASFVAEFDNQLLNVTYVGCQVLSGTGDCNSGTWNSGDYNANYDLGNNSVIRYSFTAIVPFMPGGGNFDVSAGVLRPADVLDPIYSAIDGTPPTSTPTLAEVLSHCNGNTPCNNVMTSTITVHELPIDDLDLELANDTLCAGDSTIITVKNSQVGVNYHLRNLADDSIVEGPIAGTGNDLDLNTHGLFTTTSFLVWAVDVVTNCDVHMEDTLTIVVHPRPDATLDLQAIPDEICEGDSTEILVINSVIGFEYLLRNDLDNSTVDGFLPGNGDTLRFNTSGLTQTTTFNVLARNLVTGCDIELTDKQTVIVNPRPDGSFALFATPDEICEEDSSEILILASEVGVRYELVRLPDNTVIGTAQNGTGGALRFPTGVLTVTTQFLVRATNINTECSTDSENTVTVTVNPLPDGDINIVAYPEEICAGEEGFVRIEGTEGGIGYYVVDVTTGNIISDTLIGAGGNEVIDLGALNDTVIVEVIAYNGFTGCDISLTARDTILVHPRPDSTLTAIADPAEICSGETSRIGVVDSKTGFMYEIYEDGSNSSYSARLEGNGDTLWLDLGALFATRTYRVYVEDTLTNCGIDLDTKVTVTVNERPDSTLNMEAYPEEICAGEEGFVRIYDTESGVNYYVRDIISGTILSDTVVGSGNDDVINLGALNDTVIVEVIAFHGVSGCDIALELKDTILVHPRPDSTLNAIAIPEEVCAGETADIVVIDSKEGYWYEIYEDGTNTSFSERLLGTGDSLFLNVGVLMDTTTFRIYVEDTLTNCGIDLDTKVTINVHELPDSSLNAVAIPDEICAGETSDIVVIDSKIGYFYEIYEDGTDNSFSARLEGNGDSLFLNVGTLYDTTTFRIYVEDANTLCGIDLDTKVTINVHALPDATLDAIAIPEEICAEETSDIVILNSKTGFFYEIYEDGTNTSYSDRLEGNGDSLWLNVGILYDTTTFRIYVEDAVTLCGIDLDTKVTINVHELPDSTLNVYADPDTICAEESTMIYIEETTAGFEYQLTSEGQVLQTVAGNGATIEFDTGILTETTTYTIVAVNDQTQCDVALADKVTVVVHPLPKNDLDIEAENDKICEGDEGAVIIKNSEIGVNYELIILSSGDTIANPVSGNGGEIRLSTGVLLTTTSFAVYSENATTNCSQEQSTQITIEVQPAPVAGTGDTIWVCSDEDIVNMAELISDGNATGIWEASNTGDDAGSGFDAANGTLDPSIGTGTYHFYYIDLATAPCLINDTAFVQIEVIDAPDAGTAVPGDVAYCSMDGTINLHDWLTGEQMGGTWTVVSGNVVGGTFDASKAEFNPWGNSGVYEFKYTVEACEYSDEEVVRIEVIDARDEDNDGLINAFEKARSIGGDSDNDGTPDYLDPDSDNDGISDRMEAGAISDTCAPAPIDYDGDGIPDYLDVDSDNDGVADYYEAVTSGVKPSGNDGNGDGIDDAFGQVHKELVDTDEDGLIDKWDLDSDQDGLFDIDEIQGTDDADRNGVKDAGKGDVLYANVDTDGDLLPNYQDLDSDDDMIFDVIESDGAYSDTDGRLDEVRDVDGDGADDLTTGRKIPDTNGDGEYDYLDHDSDGDLIPDEIEAHINEYDRDLNRYMAETPVDTDEDGTPDYRDLDSDDDKFTDEEERGEIEADGWVWYPIDIDVDGVPEYRDPMKIRIPEGISPNGDGYNDTFYIYGLGEFSDNHLTIFNRWGTIIFETSDYQNDWGGECDYSLIDDGDGLVPEGTYYYVLEVEGGKKAFKGFVFISR